MGIFKKSKKENESMGRDPKKESMDKYAKESNIPRPKEELSFPSPPQEEETQRQEAVPFDRLPTKDEVIYAQQAEILRRIVEIEAKIEWAFRKFGANWDEYKNKE